MKVEECKHWVDKELNWYKQCMLTDFLALH